VALAGCTNLYTLNKFSPKPLAQDFETTYQNKLQAATHWDVLAANEAAEIAKVWSSQSIDPTLTISLEQPSSPSDFSKAYKKMLTSHLLKNGIGVSRASGDYTLSYEVQVIKHRHQDDIPYPAGIYSSAYIISFIPKFAIAVAPFAVDWFLARNRDATTPNTEVLVTTEVRKGNQIVQSSTNAYYFNPGEKSLYDEENHTFSVTNES
jgi:hypothetical protein